MLQTRFGGDFDKLAFQRACSLACACLPRYQRRRRRHGALSPSFTVRGMEAAARPRAASVPFAVADLWPRSSVSRGQVILPRSHQAGNRSGWSRTTPHAVSHHSAENFVSLLCILVVASDVRLIPILASGNAAATTCGTSQIPVEPWTNCLL